MRDTITISTIRIMEFEESYYNHNYFYIDCDMIELDGCNVYYEEHSDEYDEPNELSIGNWVNGEYVPKFYYKYRTDCGFIERPGVNDLVLPIEKFTMNPLT